MPKGVSRHIHEFHLVAGECQLEAEECKQRQPESDEGVKYDQIPLNFTQKVPADKAATFGALYNINANMSPGSFN